jgi:hypothetical protein
VKREIFDFALALGGRAFGASAQRRLLLWACSFAYGLAAARMNRA